jgi:hypothetical protein
MVLKTHQIKIYREEYDEDHCGLDGYGNPKKCLFLSATVYGDFQPYRETELMSEVGNMVQGQFNLYLDKGVDIRREDKVQVEGYDGYFQVYDEPQVRGAFIPHIKCILQREY